MDINYKLEDEKVRLLFRMGRLTGPLMLAILSQCQLSEYVLNVHMYSIR